jgi:hypothetical protein
MGYQSFEDLQVWQRGKALVVEVYKCLRDCRDFETSIADSIIEETKHLNRMLRALARTQLKKAEAKT